MATSLDIKEQVLPSVILAPSSHNTQPWKFRITGSELEIYGDSHRSLTVSDPRNRQFYISLGCAITNAEVAAADEGYATKVTFFPLGQDPEHPVARLSFVPSDEDTLSYLCDAVNLRRTDRSLYDGEALSDDERATLKTIDNEDVIAVTDAKQLNQLAALTGKGTHASLSKPAFKKELSGWIRNNWTTRSDGMPGYAIGMPAPVSLFAKWLVRVAPIHKKEQTDTQRQMASTSLAAAIVTAGDTPRDWVRAGTLLELLWLEATAGGLASAPLAAAVESSSSIRDELKKMLGTEKYPQAILRIGHSLKKTQLRATPRRTVLECLQATE